MTHFLLSKSAFMTRRVECGNYSHRSVTVGNNDFVTKVEIAPPIELIIKEYYDNALYFNIFMHIITTTLSL